MASERLEFISWSMVILWTCGHKNSGQRLDEKIHRLIVVKWLKILTITMDQFWINVGEKVIISLSYCGEMVKINIFLGRNKISNEVK